MTQRGYEKWRNRLIDFYASESPWMVQKLDNLRNGYPLTDYDCEVIDELSAQRLAA